MSCCCKCCCRNQRKQRTLIEVYREIDSEIRRKAKVVVIADDLFEDYENLTNRNTHYRNPDIRGHNLMYQGSVTLVPESVWNELQR